MTHWSILSWKKLIFCNCLPKNGIKIPWDRNHYSATAAHFCRRKEGGEKYAFPTERSLSKSSSGRLCAQQEGGKERTVSPRHCVEWTRGTLLIWCSFHGKGSRGCLLSSYLVTSIEGAEFVKWTQS